MLGTRRPDEWSFSELGTGLTVKRLGEDSALARHLGIMSDASDALLLRSDGTVVHRHDCPFGTSSEDGLATGDPNDFGGRGQGSTSTPLTLCSRR